MRKWHCYRAGKISGPFSDQQMLMLVNTGRLTPDAPVTNDGLDFWYPASDVTGFDFSAKPASAATAKDGSGPSLEQFEDSIAALREETPDDFQDFSNVIVREGLATEETASWAAAVVTRIRHARRGRGNLDDLVRYFEYEELKILARHDDDTWRVRNMWGSVLYKCMCRADRQGNVPAALGYYDDLKGLALGRQATWSVKTAWAKAIYRRMKHETDAGNDRTAYGYYQDLKKLALDTDAPAEVRELYKAAVGRKKSWAM